jgi:MEMO1 family protein
MASVSELRPSPIAGTWYSNNPERLRREVEGFIEAAKLPVLGGEVVGIIAPHAGYRYSGRTAGYAFGAIRGLQPDVVVVVSPMHAYATTPVMTSAHRAYSTPLGSVEIDQKSLAALEPALKEMGGQKITAVANDHEHSLEIELPFLQCALQNDFNLLPLMLQSHDSQVGQILGRALAVVLKGRSALLVASTDLSHFYPKSEAEKLDREMLRQIADFNPEGILRAESMGTGFACGALPVAAVLWAAKKMGGTTVKVLYQSTSAEETGDTSSVVGYAAAAILKNA